MVKKRVKLSNGRTIPEEYTLTQYQKVPDHPYLYDTATGNTEHIPTLTHGQINTISEAFKYCYDIIDGNIPSCKHVKLACERFLKQHANPPKDDNGEFKFYPGKINHFLYFANQLVHSKGVQFSGTPLILSPWQVLLVCMSYGFYRKEKAIGTGKIVYRRMAQTLMVHIPRKNGKSVMTSIIGIYELLYGEPGSEVVSLATKREQANIVYNAAKAFIQTAPLHIKDKYVVKSTVIERFGDETTSFTSLSRDTGKTGDGKSISIALIDEAAAIDDPTSIEVLQSSSGARVTYMLVYLTSGGHNKETKFYRELQAYRTMLEGISDDNYTMQGLAYTLDDKSMWDKPEGWRIVCPNLDISVSEKSYQDDVNKLKMEPSGMNEFLCKKLNIYVQNETSWLSTDYYEDPQNITTTDNYTCDVDSFIGIDLSAINDLTAIVRLNRTYIDNNYNDPIYTFSYKYFYPSKSFNKVPNHLKNIFYKARDCGELIVQPGESIDQFEVADYLIKEFQVKPFIYAGYDKWNLSAIKTMIQENKINIYQVSQSMSFLSDSAKMFQMAYHQNKIKHVHSPFTQWQLGNCSLYTDANNNIKVVKGDDDNNRIDGIIASLIALNTATNFRRIITPSMAIEEITMW